MSLHLAAKHLASKGRNGDSMLVHMSPGEVKSLQGLALAAGGSLSINPNTGLVEASYLKSLLPMVAGAALTGLSGGLINPLTASAIVGGVETARTGDISKGLMAGLGAYGGAGLTSGLSQAGAAAAPEGIATAGANATPVATENAAANILKEGAGAPVSSSMPGVQNAGAEALKAGMPTPQAPVTFDNIGRGFSQLGTSGGPSAVYNALPNFTLPATAMTVANAMTPEAPTYQDEGSAELNRYSLNKDFQGYSPVRPNPYYKSPLGFAEGGVTQMTPQTDFFPQSQVNPAQYATPTQVPGSREVINADFDAAVNPYNGSPHMMAAGGIAGYAKGGLGAYSDGGRMLKGPGDGMSDDIPAVIGRKQPARLADGEFVVPADVVSHLGNGSTDAGAKRLYSMMDKVRHARTGKKKQAPAVKADKFLPA
jgi:hypothetical protein